MKDDLISRQEALDALWKALYEYEDKTGKQFQESEDLDVEDWILHRIFVQNMSDIDRQAILNLPSAQPETVRCKDCKLFGNSEQLPSAQPEIIRCKDCKYGEQDEVGRWFCRSLGCQIGNEDGSGYCADAERRTDDSISD